MSDIRKATTAEIIKLHSVLKDVLIMDPDGDDGEKFCHYKDGWNDTRVAETVSSELGNHHAQRVRREMYGNLRVGRPAFDDKRIATLESKVETLSKQIASLARALNFEFDL